jgi:hypothetical protein
MTMVSRKCIRAVPTDVGGESAQAFDVVQDLQSIKLALPATTVSENSNLRFVYFVTFVVSPTSG